MNNEIKYGTLDDLIAAAVPAVVADEAEAFLSQPVIDVQTGTELIPGDPQNCLGGDDHPEHPLCCDGCDYLEACFPEQREGKD